MTRKILLCLLAFSLMGLPLLAEDDVNEKEDEKEDVYLFIHDIEIKHTPVKNQSSTGTCWSFATISFLESEILRTKNIELDLSEMFIVRHAYPEKAVSYVRQHGYTVFAQGGQAHDVLDQLRQYGIVPESVYSGLNYGEEKHNHGEMITVMKGMMDGVIKKKGKRLTPRWKEALEAVLDVYLGELPATFEYDGIEYTPKKFADYLSLNWDDYIEITSYSQYPFYEKCRLEIPDNWTQNGDYYNVPIDDLEASVDYALKKGYTLCWDADVSERDFAYRDSKTEYSTGYAVLPLKRYDDMTIEEKDEDITEPVVEKEVTQECRDLTFDNYTTTDDHLMHLIGTARDQKGNEYYIIKNSWGTDRKYKGYYYISKSFFRMKTIAIMINRDALPRKIAQKLDL